MFAEEKYKTFWLRFWAAIIDGLVMAPFGLLGKIIFGAVPAKWMLLSTAVIYFGVYPIYSVCLHAMFGKTLGKFVTNIVVLDVSEARLPSFWQAARRDCGVILFQLFHFGNFFRTVLFVGYVSTMGHAGAPAGWLGDAFEWVIEAWYAVELATMFFSSKRRSLHDLIAGTVVVRESPETLTITEGPVQ